MRKQAHQGKHPDQGLMVRMGEIQGSKQAHQMRGLCSYQVSSLVERGRHTNVRAKKHCTPPAVGPEDRLVPCPVQGLAQ